MDTLSTSLSDNEERLRQLLNADDIGIHFRRLAIGQATPVPALLVWIEGLVSDDALAGNVVAPLLDYTGTVSAANLTQMVTAPFQAVGPGLSQLVEGILNGSTGLLVDGWDQAFHLATFAHVQHHAGRRAPNQNVDAFAAELSVNVALLRKRLRRRSLRAVRLTPGKNRAGEGALVYLEGKARPALVRQMRMWAHNHLDENCALTGQMNGKSAVYGLLPRFQTTRWPDQAAQFMEEGYVVLLVDRIIYAYVAPITAAAMLASPEASDRFPYGLWMRRFRVLLYSVALMLPGAVVALMNYHSEMMPTTFLLAIASARENAAFGVVFEVVLLALVAEVAREAALRLPVAISTGMALLASLLITLMAVQTGLVGPLPAVASAAVSLISLVLPDFTGTYMSRLWRFAFILAAVILGFFGMATVFTLFVAYLSRHRSWGIPFVGPSGLSYYSEEERSSRPPRIGGKRTAKPAPGVR